MDDTKRLLTPYLTCMLGIKQSNLTFVSISMSKKIAKSDICRSHVIFLLEGDQSTGWEIGKG